MMKNFLFPILLSIILPLIVSTKTNNTNPNFQHIIQLHHLIDDNHDGNIQLTETKQFLQEELIYEDNDKFDDKLATKKGNFFHKNDETISADELWETWKQSEMSRWTTKDMISWLTIIKIPKFVIHNFEKYKIDGSHLPKMANDKQFLKSLGVTDSRLRQQISLKATDLVLFGPSFDDNDYGSGRTKLLIYVFCLPSILILSIVIILYHYKTERMKIDLMKFKNFQNKLESLRDKIDSNEQNKVQNISHSSSFSNEKQLQNNMETCRKTNYNYVQSEIKKSPPMNQEMLFLSKSQYIELDKSIKDSIERERKHLKIYRNDVRTRLTTVQDNIKKVIGKGTKAWSGWRLASEANMLKYREEINLLNEEWMTMVKSEQRVNNMWQQLQKLLTDISSQEILDFDHSQSYDSRNDNFEENGIRNLNRFRRSETTQQLNQVQLSDKNCGVLPCTNHKRYRQPSFYNKLKKRFHSPKTYSTMVT